MPISLHASRTMISRLRARPGARTFVAAVVSSIIALAGGAPVALAQSESASCGEPGNRFTRLVVEWGNRIGVNVCANSASNTS